MPTFQGVMQPISVADKMGETYYLNQKLLVTCILDNKYVPTINPAFAVVEGPQEQMLEEEQPRNAAQLVATSGDNHLRSLVKVPESFVPSREGSACHQTFISNNYNYSGGNYSGATTIHKNINTTSGIRCKASILNWKISSPQPMQPILNWKS